MTMGVFANCTFCLNIKHLPRQQKKKLQTDIQENGGNVSFILNSQCTHIISDSAGDLSKYHLNYIQKNHIHIANPDFIWESIKERRLLDVKNYSPNKSLDSTLPLYQGASSSEVKTDDGCLDNSAETGGVELTKFYTENVEIPHFPQDFEVAKYNALEKVGTEGVQDIAVLELQCPQDPGHPTFRISACFHPTGVTETRRQFLVRPTSADASECYENYIEELKKQGFQLREHFTPEATQLASGKLQAWLLEEDIRSSALSQEVSDLVEMVWAEALGHLEHTLLTPANRISLNDVSKAEGILLHVKAALKSGETEEQLQKMMSEFYRLIPHRGSTTEEVNLRLLAKKEDLCQLIRDMANVNETNLSKRNPPSLAKYRALRCKIEHVEQNTEEFFRVRKEVLQNNRSQSPVDILQIFRVGRASETTAFLSQLGNVTSLLHGSPVRSFVGILSRGLLLPKVVEDRGVTRTDVGNLGSGIYFSDSLSTSTKYSHPGDTDGTRLLVVCDVALGKCLDLHKKDFSLTEAPPGYDSVHGVPGTATVTTDFEDDEFVVYKTNQIKMKYIIKFCLPGDEIKDFHPCNNIELEEYTPEISNFPTVEDYRLPDSGPSSSLGAGLQDASGNSVPLEDVCIKGKIIDFVAQVIVFQTYTNQSHVPIEAKYVFPLDDKAAVCGFEAFINGKHIVGEIKEKEAAHQEYREAISQGHGAYLMDQDAPDVFTVSVGNLPPKAKVLIKITYITELSIQGTVAVFFMPATVAPWQQDKALNENIQDTVKKISIKEIGSKQSFSLTMSIEMPYVIEFISSDTHELKKKSTDCKAVISTVEGSTLDSSGFSLRVGLTDAHLPRMWVEKHPEKESEACMLVFHPDLGSAFSDTAERSEVVICLDCSSSMEGVTFLHAKQIALYALSLVGMEQKVNVIRFGSGYQELFSYPKCLTSDSVAAEFITSASPTMGSTDFWKVLRYLSLLPPSQELRNVLLISDGHLQSDSLTLQLVKRHVQHTRLFSCGVGSTANRHLLRTLSQHGVGAFEYFNSKSKYSWKKQIEDQMTRSRSPSCHSVSVTWQRLSPEAPEPLQAPAQVQALFHGDRLLVYGFIPHCTQATLRALTQEEEFSTMVSTTELQKTTGTMIHKLTARALIRDYEDGILHDDETNHEMKKQVLKSLIIQLSKENCLITQFTSFVAVEERDGNESPFPNTPNILELVAKDVDILPYMSWQEVQPCGFNAPCGSAWQPLSASSDWHGEFHLSKRKQKPSTVEVFGVLEGLSLASKAPEKHFRSGWKCTHAETPLDLSQMEPRTCKGAGTPLATAISPQMAVCRSFATPRPAASPAALGSVSFSHPCPPREPPHSSLFSFCSAELSGPATSDLIPEAGCSINVFPEQDSALRGLPPNPPVESFIGPAFAGGLFGSRQCSLPTNYKGLQALGNAGTFLEVDSSPQPSPPFSSPSLSPPFSAADSTLLPPSDFSTFNFLESATPLSTSYMQPAHLLGLGYHGYGASPSNLPARNAVSRQGLRSAVPRSFGTENDETRGFLRITPFKKVAKSHVAGREFTASSQAWENQGPGICQQSQRSSVPWTGLFRLQTEDGFWKLTPELGVILNLNIDILNSFLEQKGILSLGVKGRERLLDLIATFLVLQFLRTQLEQKGIVFKSLMKLDDAAVSRDIPWASEKIKKASEWVRRTEGQYPSICQRLELGKDWDSATKQLLRLQPVNTTSPLHRVLNYGQG
ncbi:poly [ADP-ribose] polymerase 4 [Pteropus alecto]|nr:poly [ADP-ribose] polymerase 4 [Pteropus alecto]XP_015447902.1 poly [ADP-ribose] polymerase 4 [Pteropus alecto]XP_015447903.1 poly [ADP-ribose] polymerase 4 [Pteropus alecto]XP_015447904.1 poly [ADP-ribose] polymerase 4 [Pteropus alecto]XP_024905308.1 poly [ADP-ribose] polymerase 4 [Pteropus alecto]XP_024905309.1 poly [ADP-ribose] polymerase 4 [Pteropus alecto]